MFKLVSLKASGFKRLDLTDKLEFHDGRLLVYGRNESGKSTILETIHYALYGLSLRPNKRASTEDLVNYGRREAVIELEFVIDDEEYQVRRVLKKRGSNEHILNKRDPDGSLSRVSTGARAVNESILETLHGIDSDALLNSCLVEQKRLDNLEDSNKQERIKAMSSLLNMESFINAREGIRKDRSELDKTHRETERQLDNARRAATDYENAVNRKETCEKRLEEIAVEKVEVQETLERLDKELSIIVEMKRLKSTVDTSDVRLKGTLANEKLIVERIEQIEEAESSINEVEAEIPGAEVALEAATEKLAAIENLIQLNTEIAELEAKKRVITVKQEEAIRNHQESKEAAEKLRETLEKIKEYEPAREAEEVINRAEEILVEHIDVQREAKQIEAEMNQVKQRLDKQAETEDQIKVLEGSQREKEAELKRAQRNRTISIVLGTLGVVGVLLFSVNLYYPLIGLVLLGSGVFMLSQSRTEPLEEKLEEIRRNRESIIGEIARIAEYRETLETLEGRQIRPSEIMSSPESQIEIELTTLPNKPRDYRQLIRLEEPSTIDEVRSAIQEDLRSLVRFETEKGSYEGKAMQLEECVESLQAIDAEFMESEEKIKALKASLSFSEKEAEVTVEEENEVRKTRREAENTLTRLKANLKQYRDSIERKPEMLESLQKIREEIEKLLGTIKENTEKLESLESEHGLGLDQEGDTSRARDQFRDRSTSLRNEETSNKRVIEEAKSIIEKTKKIGKEFPALEEQAEREAFQLDAMKNAVTLLDTTRDGIMGGVKQSVEKNMMQFLPTLTDNRYNMAKIDETNYRINVYDREAKQWRGKGVFSGATQDQFSLALRLAFAISTIPQSRGARPGFIFLDEPLSGFDAQRRDGFMKLVREDLRQHFPQIIVISHIEGLKEEFQHHINLDEGKVQR